MIPEGFLSFVLPLALVAGGLWTMWRLGYNAGHHAARREVLRRHQSQSILHML